MKYKASFLLLIFLTSLLPLKIAQAEVLPQHSLDDALNLMYISDAILTDESEIDDSVASLGLLSPTLKRNEDTDTNPLLARIIHAKKMQRNDLDANCRLITARLRAEGKDCEVDKVNAYCQEKRSEINSQIGFYHKMRGDQRKAFTRIWHSIKRNSSNFWYRIGPVGRNFLRRMGPEVLQIVASGGTLSGGVLKNLAKHIVKSMGRERIKQVVFNGVQRLLQGQIEIAQAAGVDICDPEEVSNTKITSDPDSKEENQSLELINIEFTTSEVSLNWPSLFPPKDKFDSCGHLPSTWKFDPVSFYLIIDPEKYTAEAVLALSHHAEEFLEEGNSGTLMTELNKDFDLEIYGPFTIEITAPGRAWMLNGDAQLSVTVRGKRRCHYWEVPEQGDPILHEYWVENNKTIQQIFPYAVRFYTEDNENVRVTIQLFHSWGEYDSLTIYTERNSIPISEVEALLEQP